jgi:valyl-tRNA synthetase
MDALEQTIERVDKAADTYDFSEWSQTLYTFIWKQFCDVYIEIAKDKAPTRAPILGRVLSTVMQLLHPLMPFLTEELWQHLPHSAKRIEQAPWPAQDSALRDPGAHADMERLLEFIEAVRALRALPKLPYRELRDVCIVGADGNLTTLLEQESGIVRTLARANAVIQVGQNDGRPKHAVSRRLGAVEVLLPVDAAFIEKERAALRKEIDRAQADIQALERKLASAGFVEKAPTDVVQKEKARLRELHANLAMSSQRLDSLE